MVQLKKNLNFDMYTMKLESLDTLLAFGCIKTKPPHSALS